MIKIVKNTKNPIIFNYIIEIRCRQHNHTHIQLNIKENLHKIIFSIKNVLSNLVHNIIIKRFVVYKIKNEQHFGIGLWHSSLYRLLCIYKMNWIFKGSFVHKFYGISKKPKKN